MTEIWKNIPGWLGKYQVSNRGRVKSKSRILRVTPFGVKDKSNRPLAVSLSSEKHLVHRIVAETFIGETDRKVVLHKDGNKQNNHVDNLELMDKELHSKAIVTGSKHHQAKLNEEQVSRIKYLLRHTDMKQKEIAKQFNISTPMISLISLGKHWTHVPWPEKEE